MGLRYGYSLFDCVTPSLLKSTRFINQNAEKILSPNIFLDGVLCDVFESPARK